MASPPFIGSQSTPRMFYNRMPPRVSSSFRTSRDCTSHGRISPACASLIATKTASPTHQGYSYGRPPAIVNLTHPHIGGRVSFKVRFDECVGSTINMSVCASDATQVIVCLHPPHPPTLPLPHLSPNPLLLSLSPSGQNGTDLLQRRPGAPHRRPVHPVKAG